MIKLDQPNNRIATCRVIPRDLAHDEEMKKVYKNDLMYGTAIAFLSAIDEGKSYVVKMDMNELRDIPSANLKMICELSVQIVPEEEIRVIKDYKIVEVDQLEVRAINCKNCAAPIPVGRLDYFGDTRVRCSYCGTYHLIKKRT